MKRINRSFIMIIKWLCFLLVLVFLTQRISLMVQVYGTKMSEPDRRTCLFFELPRNTVDCLFIGTSHVYCSYIPQRIYDEAGITSASLATSSQSYQNTYWLLKEALRYQNPKAVVMDLHSVTSAVDEQVLNFRLHHTSGISAMPDFSWNKLCAFTDIKSSGIGWSENLTQYDAIGLLEYKNEYHRERNSVSELVNLLTNPQKEYRTFGFYPTTTVYPIEKLEPYVETENFMDFYTTQEYEYLNKIHELLEEQEIQLILAKAPYTMPGFDDYQLNRQALEWAEKKEIPVIDYFELIERGEVVIDLRTDFRDADHLNYLGAKKATDYMIVYLKENYLLSDHRGEQKYRLWEEMEYDYSLVEAEVKANAGLQ